MADIGGSFVTTGFGDHPGYFTAIDAHTGEIKWQKRWPESCYLGSTATGARAGLCFWAEHWPPRGVRRRERRAQVELPDRCRRQLDGDRVRARRRPADRVPRGGGNALAATPHGDNLWLFSGNGTMHRAQGRRRGGRQGVGHAGDMGVEPTQGDGDAAAGKAVGADHRLRLPRGLAGTGGNGGPDLTSILLVSDPELAAPCR